MQTETAVSAPGGGRPAVSELEVDSDLRLRLRRRRARRRTPVITWTLYRYIGVEVLRLFLISLLVISLIGTIVLAFQLTRSGIRLGFLWPVLQKSLAYPLFFSLPISLLFAVTLGLGRLAADLEISAMKANGLSHCQIAAPVLLLAVLLTAGAAYINGEVIPVVHYEKGNLRDAIIAQLEDLGSGRNRSLLLPGRVRLFVEDYQGHRFRGIRIELPASLLNRLRDRLADDLAAVQQAGTSSGARGGGLTLFSRECELEISPDRERVYLNLRGVEVLAQQRVSTQSQTEVFRQKYSISNLRLPLAFLQKGERVKDRSWAGLFEYVDVLGGRIADTRTEITRLDEKLGAFDSNPDERATDDIIEARLDQDRRYLGGELKSHVRRQNRAKTEIHRRAAFSLACFSFLFIGLPFVFLAEHRNRLVPFFYTNLFVVLPFFLLVMLGVLLGERGFYPAVALAIPNVLLLGGGVYLWSRVLKS